MKDQQAQLYKPEWGKKITKVQATRFLEASLNPIKGTFLRILYVILFKCIYLS